MSYTNHSRPWLRPFLVVMVALVALSAVALPDTAEAKKKRKMKNTVTFTINGGDANALTLCLNLVKSGDDVEDGEQANICKNHVKVRGGDVVIKNAIIKVVQANTADGDVSSAKNTVDLTIRGGDAKALAACLNKIKEGDDAAAEQENECKNKALAEGGDVKLKNVKIIIVQENDTDDAAEGDLSNSVTITIRGGDATAVAACLNAAKAKGEGELEQENFCDNKAEAKGGDVKLKNVEIIIVQENDDDGDVSDAANTVDVTIRGGDATALAVCLNVIKDGDDADDDEQENDCDNKAEAKGGDDKLKNVKILVVQENEL